jgi:hypothetical protein
VLRVPRLRATSLAVPLAVILLVACSSGEDTSGDSRRSSTTTSAAPVKVTVGEVHIESAGPDVKLDAATQTAVLDATTKYVDAAIVGPLRDGKLGAGYPALFDGNVQAPATTSDREALTDLSVGKATDGYEATVTPVRIDGVADQVGKLLFVASTLQVKVETTTAGGPLTISRSAEFTFSPASGSWKVTGYRTLTARTPATGPTTTTTAEAGAPATKGGS